LADTALIRLCDAALLVDGGAGLRFEVPHGGRLAAAFAIRHEGRVHAYLNRCAHVGVELDWVDGQFFDADSLWLVCAAHGAAYDPATGACAGGPCAGRGGLWPLRVVEKDGVVYRREEAGEPEGAGAGPA
jgi:nitrite reductase/ring-hydroxylating ferredoxin subunit